MKTISIIMPCLNEEKTIGKCIDKAKLGLKKSGMKGEIIIADNGSIDASIKIANRKKVTVVKVLKKGYGNAYLGGLKAAKGDYLVMGDSDDTYDFRKIDQLIKPLDEGYDMVIGSRIKGNIQKDAMPFLHRFVGVPLLTMLMKILFKTTVVDTHSGFRAFTKSAYRKMKLKTSGMEFASEMIINSAKANLKILEVPIIYYPRAGESKLNTFSDGWRHLRFMLLKSPDYLFFWPGVVLGLVGLLGMMVILPGPFFFLIHAWDVHAMILLAVATIISSQLISFAIFSDFLLPNNYGKGVTANLAKFYSLESGIIVGLTLFIVGAVIDIKIFIEWIQKGLGAIDQIRLAILALTSVVVGVQIIISSFLLSILQERLKNE